MSAVAFFIPHRGCPYQCTFCNQASITGKQTPADAQAVTRTLSEAAASPFHDPAGQIAFFGGSFTAIPRGEMLALLKAASPFIEAGSFSGIRISTRPDAIDAEILAELKRYGVHAIELGAQSMLDAVLHNNKRGHTARQTEQASHMIREAGFELGLQMMTGLYGDDDAGSIETADRIIALEPDTVRIYPALVLQGTELAELYRADAYKPQTLEEAVVLCADLLEQFHEAGIRVIRTGLHAEQELEQGLIAGPYHPAFRELCESRIYRNRILQQLKEKHIPPGRMQVFVPRKDISQAVGQKRQNLIALSGLGYTCKVTADAGLEKYEVRVLYEGAAAPQRG